jgi:hypothetical protein
MSSNRSAVYSPEDLSLLGQVLEQAVRSIPPSMRTPSTRLEMARNILACADKGERDPVQLELAALTNLTATVATFRAPRGSTKKAAGSMTSGPPGSKLTPK